MHKCWNDLPTAIFAAYDDFAYSAYKVLTGRGFRIPDDISVIGFDNLPLSEYIGITSVHQDRVKIGATAADRLVRLISGEPDDEPLVTRVSTDLIVRDTCGRIEA